MTPEMRHYATDRIVRAVLRGQSMTAAQITSLSDFILSKVNNDSDEDAAIVAAVKKLEQRKLSESDAIALYKANKLDNLNVDEYRKSMAPSNESAELDKKLAEIFG